MPSYDFRCNQCGRSLTLTYKTIKAYDEATPACPHCESTDLTRLITRVAIAKPSREYGRMDSQEMLSVLEGGDSREIGQMFQQVGAAVPSSDKEYHEVTDRLVQGEKPESVEADLRDRAAQQVAKDRKAAADE